ncbi:hypothetical protein M1M40_gp67 [Halorubrum tailed virus 29]|uniref:Uncharacterized protein n=1 Tax=Halorubrum tailed virus 29 TaxID=2878010 RepID=A0AAE8Y039_9CAUD|nr:hypothetical protein M1M40_gp67 [Halorubrum tailed virus 29]UBF23345.1 hypothetical protein HRTV-29_gp67 [Halorubrum tailed virus 29]
MAVATLSRGTTSVDIPLVEEGGEILVSATFGKPETQVRQSGGTLNPRVQDNWSSLQGVQLAGRLFDYQTSHDLADLVKSASLDPLELSLPSDIYPDTLTMAPAAKQDTALTLKYPAGKRDNVNVSLNLTRVGDIFAANEQQATTPTATGTGPIELRIGGTTVEVPTAGLGLERTVGRPNDVIRRQPQTADPRYEVKAKVTSDVFTFNFEAVQNAQSVLNSITDNVFREQLRRDGIIVDFNGVLGLGAIEAVPVGSAPFRQVQSAGQDWVTVPTLELRRIYSQS